MLRVYLLGTPIITYNDTPLDEFTKGSALLRLFAWLVTYAQQPQQRSQVAGIFWPEISEELARRNLTNLLWRLQKILPSFDHYIDQNRQTLQCKLQPDLWLDTIEFDQRTQQLATTPVNTIQLSTQPTSEPQLATLAGWEAALSLYRGDFLMTIDEEWTLPPRTLWHERFVNSAFRFTKYCQGWGDPLRALTFAQTLVAVEPYREHFHQQLIELYRTLERPDAARRQFEHYETLWREELALPISPAMRTLARQFGVIRHSAVDKPQAPIPILKRTTAFPQHPEYLRRQLEICFKNDELYDLMADRPQQQENLQVAEQIAITLQEPAAQIEVLARSTWLEISLGHYQAAITLAQRALQQCEQNKTEQLRAWLYRLLGVISEETGDFRAAWHHYNKALQLDEQQQANPYLAADLNNIAATELTLAHYQSAIGKLERALNLSKTTGSPRFAITLLGNLGYGWLKLGQMAEAAKALQQALTLAYRVGDRSSEWWLSTLMSKIYHLQGNSDHAITTALQHFNTVPTDSDARTLTYLADTLAWLYLQTGAQTESLHWAQWLEQYTQQKQQRRYHIRAQLRLAQAHALRGEYPQAYSRIESATKEYTQTYTSKGQTLEEEPELYFTAADIAIKAGQMVSAAKWQQQAAQSLQQQMDAISSPPLRLSFSNIQKSLYAAMPDQCYA
ncbi:MAG: tetratricopeptide repeat protein [Caldilineaceae bacterium]|nr:tetratricopeptide repeat protein [Caldilineaceae bacterium]